MIKKGTLACTSSVFLVSVALVAGNFFTGCNLSEVARSESEIRKPTEVVVEKDRFLAEFQVWVTLSNFQVELKERKLENGKVINQHAFTIDCSCSGKSDLSAGYAWVVESYENNQLIDKMRYRISARGVNGITSEKPLSLVGRPNFLADKSESDRYRFLSYFEQIRMDPTSHTQFVSGLIEPNGRQSSSVPVALKPAMDHQVILELSNPVFDFSNDQQHFLKCDYAFVHDNENPKVDSDDAHDYNYTISLVGNLGESMQVSSEFLFKENQGSFQLSNDMIRLPRSLKNYLKWRPLTIYITREKLSLGQRRKPASKLLPKKVVSNFLVIE